MKTKPYFILHSFFFLSCLGCLFTGCNKDEPSASALATVDGTPVSEETFRYWWEKSPPVADTPQTRAELLEKLVRRATLAQRAREAGLDRDPEIVEAIESLLIARLDEVELQPAIAAAGVTEDEVREVYEAQKEEHFAVPARLRAAVLWFETRGQAPLAARYRPRLEKVRQILLDDPSAAPLGEGFGQLSIANSEHRVTRFKGGDLGWIEAGARQGDKLRAAAGEIAAGLVASGDLSEVVVRDEGVFLVRLIERQDSRVRGFDEVRGTVGGKLLTAKRAAAKEAFEIRMAAGVEVERYPNHLSGLAGLPVREAGPTQPFPTKLTQETAKP